MAWEESTPWGKPVKMTHGQVKKYIQNMKKNIKQAEEEIKKMEASWEKEAEEIEVKTLEKKIDEAFD